jgi:hypothetical protein
LSKDFGLIPPMFQKHSFRLCTSVLNILNKLCLLYYKKCAITNNRVYIAQVCTRYITKYYCLNMHLIYHKL